MLSHKGTDRLLGTGHADHEQGCCPELPGRQSRHRLALLPELRGRTVRQRLLHASLALGLGQLLLPQRVVLVKHPFV
jgi:hypothetical protein